MAQIRRSPAGPRLRLTTEEVQLLRKLADEIDALLSGRADADEFAPSDEMPASEMPASEMPASEMPNDAAVPGAASSEVPTAGELEAMTGLNWTSTNADHAALPPEDPALRRLLPDAYHDDPEAAADFRRYTEATLRRGKRADVTAVRQGLASIGVTGERVLDEAQAHSWLRFLTDARLVLASRLGIERPDDIEAYEQLPTDDPRFMAYVVYEWLAPLLGDLVTALDPGSH